MVMVERAMTPMGLTRAAGKEIISIRHGRIPALAHSTRSPVSFREEWGEQQREARCGAIIERPKIASSNIRWSKIATRLSSHCRLKFQQTKQPTQLPNPPPLGPIFIQREKGETPKHSRDLHKWQSLEHFVNLEMEKIDCLVDCPISDRAVY